MSKPTFCGLVRSNFWKGRQRLNRLYRWLANVVRPKIDIVILWEASPQNNPGAHEFLIGANCHPVHPRCQPGPEAIRCDGKSRLTAAELTARRSAPGSAASARTFILVAEDQTSLLQIVRRHLDRHPVAGQRLDPVLFHLAGSIGDDFMPGIELHTIAGIGKDFGDQSFELDQLFFSHGSSPDRLAVSGSLGTVRVIIRTAFAMQEGDALDAFCFGASLRRARWFVPINLVAVGLRSAVINTATA